LVKEEKKKPGEKELAEGKKEKGCRAEIPRRFEQRKRGAERRNKTKKGGKGKRREISQGSQKGRGPRANAAEREREKTEAGKEEAGGKGRKSSPNVGVSGGKSFKPRNRGG